VKLVNKLLQKQERRWEIKRYKHKSGEEGGREK
jgi:hypothetical protein